MTLHRPGDHRAGDPISAAPPPLTAARGWPRFASSLLERMACCAATAGNLDHVIDSDDDDGDGYGGLHFDGDRSIVFGACSRQPIHCEDDPWSRSPPPVRDGGRSKGASSSSSPAGPRDLPLHLRPHGGGRSYLHPDPHPYGAAAPDGGNLYDGGHLCDPPRATSLVSPGPSPSRRMLKSLSPRPAAAASAWVSDWEPCHAIHASPDGDGSGGVSYADSAAGTEPTLLLSDDDDEDEGGEMDVSEEVRSSATTQVVSHMRTRPQWGPSPSQQQRRERVLLLSTTLAATQRGLSHHHDDHDRAATSATDAATAGSAFTHARGPPPPPPPQTPPPALLPPPQYHGPEERQDDDEEPACHYMMRVEPRSKIRRSTTRR